MFTYRDGLVACATLFAAVMTSAAFAGCGGCGGGFVAQTYAQPLVYAPAPPPVEYVAPVYAPIALPPPVAPLPIVAAPIAVEHWDTGGWGGCGCNRGLFAGSAFGGPGLAPAPIYIVNQGPEYSGPGIMIPYNSYLPEAGLPMPGTYPYIGRYGYPRYGHQYYGARYAYHPHYWRRHVYPHRWRG
jgi:hypothetical protein